MSSGSTLGDIFPRFFRWFHIRRVLSSRLVHLMVFIIFRNEVASGMPCILPEGVVKGVCRSACASIHITPSLALGLAIFSPAMVAPAVLWSPDSTTGNQFVLDGITNAFADAFVQGIGAL